MDEGFPLERSQESPAMGQVMPPKGLPANIKCLVITYDTLNDNVQIAGPLNDEALVNHMFYRAADEVEKFWEKRNAEKNN